MSKENKLVGKILLGATGSVAAMKIPLLIERILRMNDHVDSIFSEIKIKLVVTENAEHFFRAEDIDASVEVYRDELEWSSWKKRGDPVVHIELGKWADLMLIAPLDANTLAKMAQGICDNLLTCTTRAWDMQKPLLFCPAMNTRMWQHPVTKTHMSALTAWGHTEVPCVEKTLICGDTGLGAMAEVDTIVRYVKEYVKDRS